MSGLPVIDSGGGGGVSSTVSVSSLPPTPAGTNNIGTVGLAAGVAAIGSVSVSNFPSTQTIAGSVTANIGALNGAASEATLLTVKTAVDAVTSAIRATVNIDGTVWADATTTVPTYYVRRESVNEGTGVVTVAWFTPSGATASPTIANLKPLSNVKDLISESIIYTATAAGTGYSTSDVLVLAFGLNTATTPATVAFSFWLNATTGAVISSPTGGSFVPATQQISAAALPLPTGAATAAKQPAIGTAGTSSADVITIQGISGGTPQPVSGTISDANSAVISAPTVVTPSDSTVLTPPKLGIIALVSGAGNVTLTFANGTSIAIPVLVGFSILPFSPTKIMATGTTAIATFYLNN